jgi:hypothetical protein
MVIDARQTYVFDGWRVSDDQTREIVFGTPESSVAAQSSEGDPSNVGVIGFIAWREAVSFAPAFDVAVASPGVYGGQVTRGGALTKGSGAPEAFGAGSVGSGIGAYQESRVGRTRFNRTGDPDILVIGYDTEGELASRGILVPPDPDPFPGLRTGYDRFTPSS